MKLEKSHECKNENFIFTLTDSQGQRVYGVCLRALFRGPGRRYDVGRRLRHCLCFITRLPFFSMFRVILHQLHSIGLIEETPNRCRQFVEVLYEQSYSRDMGTITIPRSRLDWMMQDVLLVLPPSHFGLSHNRDVQILPLFEVLGVDRFFLLLSAILCERRVIFVAEEAETLSNSVLAAASAVSPFSWQHIFIPHLPSKLLNYVSAPMPYLIGVRKYLVPSLEKLLSSEGGGGGGGQGVVVVDCDSGKIVTFGSVQLIDLVGDSSNKLRQASDSLAKAASLLFSGGGGGAGAGGADDRDIMAVIVADLQRMGASKPGTTSSSLQAVAGLLGVGGGRSSEQWSLEADRSVRWSLEADRSVREALTCLFLFLLGDLEEKRGVSAGRDRKGGGLFAAGDSRSSFDVGGLLVRWEEEGGGGGLLRLLQEVIHSQMFERFCQDRRGKGADLLDPSPTSFDAALHRLKSSSLRNHPLSLVTVARVKQAVGGGEGTGCCLGCTRG